MFSFSRLAAISLFCSTTFVHGLKYDASEEEFNLNANTTATDPRDYWVTERTDHVYNPSPSNWRFPFYTVFMDRFVNGDPTNDNMNGTVFETDMMSTQIRNGGDLQGLVDSLDYIAGMGIKVRPISLPHCVRDSSQLIVDRVFTLLALHSSTSRGVLTHTL